MGLRIAIAVGFAALVGLAVFTAVPRAVDPSTADEVAALERRTATLPPALEPIRRALAARTPAAAPTHAAAPAPAAAPGPAAGLDAAVDACVRAQREVAARRRERGRPSPPGEPSDAAVVSRACAPLYKKPACRDALLQFDTPPPAARASTVFQVCARAYCGELPAPRPSACTQPPNEPSQMAAAWGELRDAILAHDIGPDAAARVAHALSR